jgi:hypothetical protein
LIFYSHREINRIYSALDLIDTTAFGLEARRPISMMVPPKRNLMVS